MTPYVSPHTEHGTSSQYGTVMYGLLSMQVLHNQMWLGAKLCSKGQVRHCSCVQKAPFRSQYAPHARRFTDVGAVVEQTKEISSSVFFEKILFAFFFICPPPIFQIMNSDIACGLDRMQCQDHKRYFAHDPPKLDSFESLSLESDPKSHPILDAIESANRVVDSFCVLDLGFSCCLVFDIVSSVKRKLITDPWVVILMT